MINVPELYKKVKKHYGAMTEIGKRAGVSHQFVYMVLSGRKKSTTVVTKACEYLVEKEKKEAEQRALQAKLLAEANDYINGLAAAV